MKIIIEVAGDVYCDEAKSFMDELSNEILNQEKFKHIIKDVKVKQ